MRVRRRPGPRPPILMSVCSSVSSPVALLTGLPTHSYSRFGELRLHFCSFFGGEDGGPPVPSHATATTAKTPNATKVAINPENRRGRREQPEMAAASALARGPTAPDDPNNRASSPDTDPSPPSEHPLGRPSPRRACSSWCPHMMPPCSCGRYRKTLLRDRHPATTAPHPTPPPHQTPHPQPERPAPTANARQSAMSLTS